MKKIIILILMCLPLARINAQVSSTEIFLVDIIKKDKKVTFGTPVNITNHEGYDNQPEFSPDGKKILYVSMPDTNHTDIYEYSIEDSLTKQISETPESEYSIRFAPNGKIMSVVQVDADKGQRLYQFTGDPQDLYNLTLGMDSVAYYNWLNDSTVALACLNNGMELCIYEISNNQFVVLSKGIGRCLLREPMVGDLIYSKGSGDQISLLRYEIATGETVAYCDGLPGAEDYIFDKDGKLLASNEGKLFSLDPNGENKWIEIADFSKTVGTFYRMAASHDGKRLALVSYKGKRP